MSCKNKVFCNDKAIHHHEYARETVDREIFKEFINSRHDKKKKQYSFRHSDDIFCVYDVMMSVVDRDNPFEGKNYLVEIKCRDIDINDYTSAMIDHAKLMALKEEGKKYNVDGIYIVCYYPFNNKIAMWNLKDIEFDQYTRVLANRNTENSRDDKVRKEMNYMRFDKGIIYDYDLSDFYRRVKEIENNN